MKIIKILLLLLLTSFHIYSQNVKELTLEVKNLSDGTGFYGNVYLMTFNGLSQPYSCENGNVQIIFDDSLMNTNRTFITIRQDNNSIANVNMNCLISSKGPIILPKMSVEVKEFSSIPMLTELSEILILLSNGSDEKKVNPDLKDDGGFYPKRVFRKANDQTKYLANRMAWLLQFLNEPILCNKHSTNAYRFTWTSNQYPYEYDPYSVRIEIQEDGHAIMFCNYYCGKEERGSKLNCDIISMDSLSLGQFIQKTNDVDLKDEVFSAGAENNSIIYSFEANIDGHYHVIFRGEGEDPALDELQRFLWSLTGLGENKIVHRRMRIE